MQILLGANPATRLPKESVPPFVLDDMLQELYPFVCLIECGRKRLVEGCFLVQKLNNLRKRSRIELCRLLNQILANRKCICCMLLFVSNVIVDEAWGIHSECVG